MVAVFGGDLRGDMRKKRERERTVFAKWPILDNQHWGNNGSMIMIDNDDDHSMHI